MQTARDSAYLPTAATANRRCFAKATCPRQLTQTSHRKHPPLRKSNMPPLSCPNPPPPTRAAPQKKHSFATNPHMQPQAPAALQKKHAPAYLPTAATANSPQPATANTRLSAKEACPCLLAPSRNRKQAPICKSNMPPQTHPNPPAVTANKRRFAQDTLHLLTGDALRKIHCIC